MEAACSVPASGWACQRSAKGSGKNARTSIRLSRSWCLELDGEDSLMNSLLAQMHGVCAIIHLAGQMVNCDLTTVAVKVI